MVHGTCDSNDPNCLSPVLREPWETDFGALVPRFTGSLSAISSALIITVILRSHSGLGTSYHRIMFGMSVADICSSIAIALTSLPMPTHMPKEEEFGYYWAGTRLGNTATCNAQGFFYHFGVCAALAYNGTLCAYYACSIALAMKEENIKKYVEPVLHILPVSIGLLVGVFPIKYEMYNPPNSSYAWCAIMAYPQQCSYEYYELDCIRGSVHAMEVLHTTFSVGMIASCIVIGISMFMVIIKTIQINTTLNKVYKHLQNRSDTAGWHREMNFQREAMMRQHNLKATVIHALSYILAFLIPWFLPFLNNLRVFDFITSPDDGYGWQKLFQIEKAMLFLMPLQGFFNFFIFISLKIYTYRQNHSISICHAFVKVLVQRNQEPCYISHIFIVDNEQEDENDLNNANNIVDIDLTQNDHDRENYESEEKKLYVFSMVDESSNNSMQYRIHLFKKDADLSLGKDNFDCGSSERREMELEMEMEMEIGGERVEDFFDGLSVSDVSYTCSKL